MHHLDNKLIREAFRVLQARLPDGWRCKLGRKAASARDSRPGARIEIGAPDGRTAKLPVELRQSLRPRGVIELAARLKRTDSLLVVAPYLSVAVRERLAELGVGFLDLTGNIRIVSSKPGLFIDAAGADVNPDRSARQSRTLRGAKAGRIVRLLLDRRIPPGVRELAELADIDPGYVSRIMSLLDQRALIERTGYGRVVSVDWPRLLERWAEDAPLGSRGGVTMCLAPRGLKAVTTALPQSSLSYAVTGTLAVARLAPVAETRLAVIYLEDAEQGIERLDLRITERGANVMLIEPSDEGVYTGSIDRDGLRAVAVSQAAADLMTSPGRGPAEAEALIAWMKENEDAWRE